jgi:predicted metal-dependent hydrolase
LSIEEFILAVKEERFVEAHELLEDEWRYYKKTEEKNKAKAIQGLINGATALALFRKNRREAYERIWKVFKKYNHLLEKLDSNTKYYEASRLLELKNSSITN